MSFLFPLLLKNFCSKKESKIEITPHNNKLYGHSEIIITPVLDWNFKINPTIRLEIPKGRKKTIVIFFRPGWFPDRKKYTQLQRNF